MRFDLDSYLGIHQDAMMLRSRRNTVIASNIANADTPGYKARDIDFQQALQQAQGGQPAAGTLRTTHARHIGGGDAVGGAPLKYREPMQPAVDGNTVETEREQAEFSKNAVRYQASLSFVNSSIRGMITALKGGQR
jgi:flagellar basal-body rod protein FlgB